MKKIVALSLVVIIIFSFVACGGKEKSNNSAAITNDSQAINTKETFKITEPKATEPSNEIVITLDNWQDYIELKYMPSWDYNAFDEIEGFSCLYPVLALKEEYAHKTVSSDTELAVGYTATRIFKTVIVDLENKSFKWEDTVVETKEVNETAKYYHETMMGDPRILDEGGLIFLFYGTRVVNGVECFPYHENFTITRIEGTLIFE